MKLAVPTERVAAINHATTALKKAPRSLRERFAAARKRTRVLLVIVLVAVLALLGGGIAWWQTTALPADAAFRIGDRVVTADELDRQVDTLRALYGVQPPADPTAADGFRRDSAKSYAVAIILDNAARDQGVQVADKAARDMLDRFVAGQLGEGPDARRQFVDALGIAGTTEQAVLDEVKRQMAVGQLMDRVTTDVTVTDQDVAREFEARRDQLATPEKRHLANIVVPDQATADQAAARIRAGEPFAAVAQSVSLDQSTRDKGGDLGDVARAQLEQGYGDAAFGAAQGGVFGPVQTQHGWNVGTVLAVTASVPAQLDAIRDPFRQRLEVEKATNQWRDWISGQIKAADVDYADDYRPADPDAAPNAAGAPTGTPR